MDIEPMMMPRACVLLYGFLFAAFLCSQVSGEETYPDDPWRAEYQAGLLKDAEAARALCNDETFKGQPCGWASDEEIAKTLDNQCPFCGTYWWGEPKPPTSLESHPNYYQVAGRITSLACQGPVVVRALLKLVSDYSGECAAARLGEPGQSVTRCELLVPEGDDKDELERVIRAKEVNCKACYPCADGGCTMEKDRWYADTFTTTLDGCTSVQDTSKGYRPIVMQLTINGGVKIYLAKFEVCSDAACFDQEYEETKGKNQP